MEYIVYTDESDKTGKYFGNFYGGVLVRSSDQADVLREIADAKADLLLRDEVKWTKVTANYLDKDVNLMDCFFDLVASDKVKVRVMFTKNSNIALNLTAQQRRETYHRLYYQFLKHAFGLRYAGSESTERVGLRINLDQLPSNREQNRQFKAFVLRLNENKYFDSAGIFIREDQIAEVSSHDHDLLQCLDIVLGAIAFRLNDKHKEKPSGQSRRGKKTIAKEALYRHINSRIRAIYPGFNIGITTGRKDQASLWTHPYRHWLFTPKTRRIDPYKHKP